MWQAIRDPDPDGGERLTFTAAGAAISFRDVLAGWRDEPGFRETTLTALAATGMPSFFWEMPPLDVTTLDRPYECMVLPAIGLDRLEPDPAAFAQKFAAAPDTPIVVFDNLGGDATLVAPRPLAPFSAYGHIAAFVRAAPAAQRHALLRAVSETATARLSARPLWLSTSGLGVVWLHVRLDAKPKYYACDRYRRRT